jgi:hypothetical protein
MRRFLMLQYEVYMQFSIHDVGKAGVSAVTSLRDLGLQVPL